MTVRVNKSSFNIREKLSELERPIGLKGSELMRAETAQDARDFVSAGRKNLIINGDVRVWQRGTSATLNTSTNTQHKTADRWNHWHDTDGAVTESRSTDVPAGAGFYYSLKHEVSTADTSIAAGQYHAHKYDIEGYDVAHLMWGTSQAKPITVSFWVKSSVVGDYGFCVRPGANNSRLYVDTLKINQANTWEYKTFTVPGCTDGTWEKTNSAGMQVQISLAMGTTYQTSSLRQWISVLDVSPTTQVNWMATVGNTWYITGLQLEVGKNATEFEHRSYGEELALCQRYYQKSYPTEVTPGTNVSASLGFAGMEGRTGMSNVSSTGEHFRGTKLFPSMRTTPNITIYDRVGNSGKITGTKYLTADYDNITASVQNVCATGFQAKCINVGDFGGISFHYTANAEL